MGVEFQTFFDIANLALTGKLQLVEAGPFSLAVRSDMGGGTGDERPRHLLLRRRRHRQPGVQRRRDRQRLDALLGLVGQVLPDRRRSAATASTPDTFCTRSDRPGRCCSATRIPNSNRFTGQRLYFGIGVTAAIDRFTSFFFQIEGLPFADQLSYKPRLAFMDAYNGALIAKNDHFVYGMAGISLKF